MINLDECLKTIISIFSNPEVKLVRLQGLQRYLSKFLNTNLELSLIDNIIHKFKTNKLISYIFIHKCPYCGEIIYQIEEIDPFKLKVCDNCQQIFNPILGESLFELPSDYQNLTKKMD